MNHRCFFEKSKVGASATDTFITKLHNNYKPPSILMFIHNFSLKRWSVNYKSNITNLHKDFISQSLLLHPQIFACEEFPVNVCVAHFQNQAFSHTTLLHICIQVTLVRSTCYCKQDVAINGPLTSFALGIFSINGSSAVADGHVAIYSLDVYVALCKRCYLSLTCEIN